MNILIISGLFPPEPLVSAKISFELAKALSQNHQVTVICQRPSRPLGFKFEPANYDFPFRVHILDSYICPESTLFGRFRESFSFGRESVAFLQNSGLTFDVIYMNAWPLLAQLLIAKAAKKMQINLVNHVQDIYPESLSLKLPFLSFIINRLLVPLDRFILLNSTKIVAISERMKNHLVATRKIPENKVEVVCNWQNEEEFLAYSAESSAKSKNGLITFMYLGNIGPVAGVEFLIESFGLANLTGAKLIIAGTGSRREFCKKLSERYRESIIEFVDVPAGAVAEIQKMADVLLLPIIRGAASSSIPSKLPSYMFSRKPIIGCVDSESDTAQAIKRSQCGWILPPEDRSALIKTMGQVLCMSVRELNRMGQNGFEFALQNFSKRNNLQRLTSCITNSFSIIETK